MRSLGATLATVALAILVSAAPAASEPRCDLPTSHISRDCIEKEIDERVFVPCMRRLVPGIDQRLGHVENKLPDHWLAQILLRHEKFGRDGRAVREALWPYVYGKEKPERDRVYRIGIQSCIDTIGKKYRIARPPRKVTRL